MSRCKVYQLEDGSRRLIKAYSCRIRTMPYGYRLYLLHGRPLDLTAPTRLEAQKLLCDFLQPDLMDLSQHASNQIKPPPELYASSEEMNSDTEDFRNIKRGRFKGVKSSYKAGLGLFIPYFIYSIYSNNNVIMSLVSKLMHSLINLKNFFLALWTLDTADFCPKQRFLPDLTQTKCHPQIEHFPSDTVKIDLTPKPTTVKVKPKGA